jgi:hypothetical protein
MRLDRSVHVWLGDDAEAFMRAEDAADDPDPTLTMSDDEANALVVALLRGPQGPPGVMGPMGASAP